MITRLLFFFFAGETLNQSTAAWYVSNFMEQGKDEHIHTDLASSEVSCFGIYKQIGSMTGITNVDRHERFRVAFLSARIVSLQLVLACVTQHQAGHSTSPPVPPGHRQSRMQTLVSHM